MMKYPPSLLDEQLDTLISDIRDWQLTNGSLLKLVQTEEENAVLAQPVGITVFPTLFPRQLFHEAISLQKLYNKLYIAVAEDEEWLHSILRDLIELNPLANTLWGIYQEAKQEGYRQNFSLGVFRSDYMLHVNPSNPQQRPQLKQVEFNTISVAGGTHGNKISEMHQHLHRTGSSSSQSQSTPKITCADLPPNNTIKIIAAGLAAAHTAYGPPKSLNAKQTCILFIVQPLNFNIADERPLEYALWSRDPAIPAYRIYWGDEVLSHSSLTSSRELLYQRPGSLSPMEVSVVYYRSGFEEHEYDFTGRQARLQLEKSRAIKCPSLLSHLTTFKKVQQELAIPGVLERFLTLKEAEIVTKTFAPMYPLDESEAGIKARRLALDMKTANGYVLKPSLEGGGHNIYGGDIPYFLAKIPKERWHTYVLMEKITPPPLHNMLISPRGSYEGPVVSELGIFGVSLWKGRKQGRDGKGNVGPETMEELEPTWSFKTKDAGVDEMSVVKGYGCFDSPALMDWDMFSASCGGHEPQG
jgi:glutathione synthetase